MPSLEYIGTIIASSRQETGETDYSDTNGTPQSVPIEAANEALIQCQSLIYGILPQAFESATEEIDGVAGQTHYDAPANCWLGTAIEMIEFSIDGTEAGYYELDGKSGRFKDNALNGYPSIWYPEGIGGFAISPPPKDANGTIRVTYTRALDSLQLRIGKIAAVTKDVSMENYTSITLADVSSSIELDTTALSSSNYLCVNTKFGEVVYYNIGYDYDTDFNTSTKVLTFDPVVPVSAGVISVGDYITTGQYTTTHAKLGKECHSILKGFINRRFYLGRSSSDVDAETDNITLASKRLEDGFQHAKANMSFKPRYKGKFE